MKLIDETGYIYLGIWETASLMEKEKIAKNNMVCMCTLRLICKLKKIL